MLRLFTAIELPDDVRDSLARLRQPLPGAKWVDRADLHLTLRFAGDIEPRAATEFASNLSLIDADVFELRLAGLGVFGGAAPHTLWAGVEENAALEALHRQHERAARNAGLKPETRKFAPHVTLARFRGAGPDPVAKYLTRMGRYRSTPFFVERTVLLSSRPLLGGGPYGVEEAFALRGSFDDGSDDAWHRA